LLSQFRIENSGGGSTKTTATTSTYVNTDDFRLRFLRCELFDVAKAAIRMTKYLELVLDLFGDYALQRPIRLADFSRSELKDIRKGRFQFLPYPDRGGITGRRVMVVIPDHEWESISPRVRNKIMLYTTWVAGNDVHVQQEGIVFVAWFEKSSRVTRKPAIETNDHKVLTVRPCAIHCCSPDTPFYRFRRSVMTMRIGREFRSKLMVHVGESVELRYNLHTYGIPSEQIPITYTGMVKVTYMRQWVRLREMIEGEWKNEATETPTSDANSARENGQSTSPNTNTNKKLIEFPYLSDIIFRKGSALMSHPGNVALRTLIMVKVEEELEAKENEGNPKQLQKEEKKEEQPGEAASSAKRTTNKPNARSFVLDVIKAIREETRLASLSGSGKECRFLAWNEGGWWQEIDNLHDVQTRVEYIARGIRKSVGKRRRSASVSPSVKTEGQKGNNSSNARRKATRPPQQKKHSAVASCNNAGTSIVGSAIGFEDLFVEDAKTQPMIRDSNQQNRGKGFVPAAPNILPTQHQHGGTSVFRFQDNSQNYNSIFGRNCFLPDSKKRKTMTTINDESNSSNYRDSSSKYSDDDGNTISSESACFGIDFNDLW